MAALGAGRWGGVCQRATEQFSPVSLIKRVDISEEMTDREGAEQRLLTSQR